MEQDLLDTLNTFTTYTIDRLDIITTTSRRQPPATLPQQILIKFNFSCKPVVSYSFFNPLQHQPSSIDESLPPQVHYTVLYLSELLNHSEASQLLHQRLCSWCPYLSSSRQQWIDQVLERARDDVGSMPANHKKVVVDFRVIVQVAVVYYVGVGPEVVDEGADNYMVPTKESWIESVVEKKIVLVDSSESCTVCLEDFRDGSEGVLMPCAHVFHGDCIGEWLRTSHYCPVCRFEFPTD